MTTDDTDPTPSSAPNSTDPIFPPKLGKAGPKNVSVTAVQGPGVDPQPVQEITTTERLLSGLLEGPPKDAKGKEKPRKRETSGEEAANYSASPRPVPVGRKESAEDAVIVAPPSGPLRRADVPALEAKGSASSAAKGTRDDRTVPLPRKTDFRGLVAFLLAVVLVGGVAWLLLAPPSKPVTTPTRVTSAPPATATGAANDPNAIPPPQPVDDPSTVQADPIIESQQLKHPTRPTPARPPAPSVAVAPSAAATPPATTPPPAPPGVGTAPPDFDELKKGIKH